MGDDAPVFALIALIPGILLVQVLYRPETGARDALLRAAVLWGLSVVAITEFLSTAHALKTLWIAMCWFLITVVLLAVAAQRRHLKKLPRFSFLPRKGLSRGERLSYFGLLVIAGTTGFIAIFAPPNNWDSMAYHLARVVNWLQQGSVEHYPTHYLQNLFQNPWAEFTISHLISLGGGDRLVNLVQWSALVGSVFAVSALAGLLGANRRGQLLSAVVAATLPMGILQASSTQNDLTVGFWLLCLVYFGLHRRIVESTNRADLVFLGASVGLAILTKGTAYVYAFPFLVWFVASDLKRLKWKAWKPWAAMGSIALVVNAGHYLRNLSMFSTPLGITAGSNVFSNQAFSAPLYLANLVKNTALQFSTPIRSINTKLIEAATAVNGALGVEINDRRTSLTDFDLPTLINHEEFAGNAVAVILIGAAVGAFLLDFRRSEPGKSVQWAYLAAASAALLLFSLAFRWQIWGARLHLPYFLLMAPWLGTRMGRWRSARVSGLIAALLLVGALPFLLFNETRPIVANSRAIDEGVIENVFTLNRTDLYFMSRPDVMSGYLEAVDRTAELGCSNVGLLFDESPTESPWEYPFWVLLQDRDPDVRLSSIAVANESSAAYDPAAAEAPCAVLYAGPAGRTTVDWMGQTYGDGWSTRTESITVAVLVPN